MKGVYYGDDEHLAVRGADRTRAMTSSSGLVLLHRAYKDSSGFLSWFAVKV